jgi:hypothetical protein
MPHDVQPYVQNTANLDPTTNDKLYSDTWLRFPPWIEKEMELWLNFISFK